jgi:predicted RNA-binding protein with PIN domain
VGRTFLIDGYNLLHQVLDFNPGLQELEGMRDRLLHRLVSLSAQKGIKMRVVFDGPFSPSTETLYPGIDVKFAPSADNYIRAVIERLSGRRELVIVSSDQKDIGNYASLCGLEWMTSQDFWEWLMIPPKRYSGDGKSDRDDTGAPPGWTSADDEEYLRKLVQGETDFGDL